MFTVLQGECVAKRAPASATEGSCHILSIKKTLKKDPGGEGNSQHWPRGSTGRLFVFAKLRDSAREIIRRPESSDDAPS